MRRAWLFGVALLVVAGCSSNEPSVSGKYGKCDFVPRTNCSGQNLNAVTLQFSDLRGADLSNADFTDANLHGADLRDANLSGASFDSADMTDTDLRGANLAGTKFFRTDLDRARWTGTDRSATKFCQAVLPDGSISDCPTLTDLVPSVSTTTPPRPQILEFAVEPPGACLSDAVGEGIELRYRVAKASQIGVSVDDVRLQDSQAKQGIIRVPVDCDGKRHTFELVAFGAAPPPATRTITYRVGPPRQATPVR
jgi:uncharacterized protein YjbI with pentapeptide repeats